MKPEYSNQLIAESSPYLLQHAGNPVNWYPWGEEALNKAKEENKLLIVSIGYAACHWCHVMEHESFEDNEVAAYMNDHFISVKVDREERPDIDQIYMHAVQLLTGRGGWPLNVIALPDGRPLYGGTYFQKEQWLTLLRQVNEFVSYEPDKALQQALALTEGIATTDEIKLSRQKNHFSLNQLHKIFDNWKNNIDKENGGYFGAPKFPLPAGHRFLLHYAYLTGNSEALNAVMTTLYKMANGGIYDQIGGGFARYSTDAKWKVPHFEKMLYDNAQLVSLYTLAYQQSKVSKYKRIVEDTLAYIQREMTSEEGGFYSSLDADSEGEEGKYYVWTKREIQEVAGDNASMVIDYYGILEEGNWHNGKNIPFKSTPDDLLSKKYGITEKDLRQRISITNKLLLHQRAKRVKPALDDKILTSWNALMLKSYAEAYRVFGKKNYLSAAIKSAGFILMHMKSPDYCLSRNYKNGKSTINGFLDDYAFTIDAFIALYQATFIETYLQEARNLLEYALSHFYDQERGMFYYTSDIDPALVVRRIEITDNVIPSANAIMAQNLYTLGHYFYHEDYIDKSLKMLNNVRQEAMNGSSYYASWNILMAWIANKPFEVAILGDNYLNRRKEFDIHYFPDVFLSGGKKEGTLPLHRGKLIPGHTTIYVCRDKTCQLPVTHVKEAHRQIMEKQI
jgi:uncharacterized protein